MFNHGTISAMLFILVGVIYERAHHREIEGSLRFGKSNASIHWYYCSSVLCRSRLPGLSGFISEAMCFHRAFPVYKGIVIASTIDFTKCLLIFVGISKNFLWKIERKIF